MAEHGFYAGRFGTGLGLIRCLEGQHQQLHSPWPPTEDKPRPDQQDGDKSCGYTLAVKQNDAFELYYKTQQIVPEAEWDSFMEHLRKPLPATFRVTGFRSQAQELVNLIKSQYLPSLSSITIEGRSLEPPKGLSWYPNELAWQLNLERDYIRKNEHLAKLHEFLVSETESGNISRQEAVSMIPPLVLDVKPHHKVLDMCAAPGSKTSQLIEMLHADENTPFPDGFVVANDSDNRRCYLMVHQVKRIESPNFVIINHDASQLPNLWTHETDNRKDFITYDRVLCDVPCSGDGTMRKNADVWTKWNPGAAANLHGLQSRILKRGLELLTVGGRLVYSTCSFNPIENEAVVANLLHMCKGTVELVDVEEVLPGLERMPGMSMWKVMNKNGDFYDKFEDVPEKFHTQIRPSMFPPPAEKLRCFNLNRCVRVLPHHQNTGGFFVAVLKKTSQLMWMKSVKEGVDSNAGGMKSDGDVTEGSEEIAEKAGEKRKQDEEAHARNVARPSKKQKIRGYNEDPFIWLTKEDPVWPPIKEFYGLSDDFKAELLMVRCADGKKRNIYYTSDAIKMVATYSHKVKFINMGVKLLARSDSPFVKCDFRLVQDGINTIYPYIQARIVEIKPEDLITILEQDNPFTTKISDFSRENIEALDPGGCVFVCKESGLPTTPACDVVLTGWKGRSSCRSFLRKYERSHFLRMFGQELKPRDKKSKTEDTDNKGAVAACTKSEETMEVVEDSEDVKPEIAETNVVACASTGDSTNDSSRIKTEIKVEKE